MKGLYSGILFKIGVPRKTCQKSTIWGWYHEMSVGIALSKKGRFVELVNIKRTCITLQPSSRDMSSGFYLTLSTWRTSFHLFEVHGPSHVYIGIRSYVRECATPVSQKYSSLRIVRCRSLNRRIPFTNNIKQTQLLLLTSASKKRESAPFRRMPSTTPR